MQYDVIYLSKYECIAIAKWRIKLTLLIYLVTSCFLHNRNQVPVRINGIYYSHKKNISTAELNY